MRILEAENQVKYAFTSSARLTDLIYLFFSTSEVVSFVQFCSVLLLKMRLLESKPHKLRTWGTLLVWQNGHVKFFFFFFYFEYRQF